MMLTEIDLLEAINISISSMLIVFIILLLIMGILMLFKYIPELEYVTNKYRKNHREKFVPFEKMDDDMKVAVLVATIDYKKTTTNDVVLKSVKKL